MKSLLTVFALVVAVSAIPTPEVDFAKLEEIKEDLSPLETPLITNVAPSTPFVAPSTPFVAPSTPYVAPSSPFVAPSTPYVAPSSPYVAPSTPFVSSSPIVATAPLITGVAPNAPLIVPSTPLIAPSPVVDSAVVDRYEGTIPGEVHVVPTHPYLNPNHYPYSYDPLYYDSYLKVYPHHKYYGFSEHHYRTIPSYHW